MTEFMREGISRLDCGHVSHKSKHYSGYLDLSARAGERSSGVLRRPRLGSCRERVIETIRGWNVPLEQHSDSSGLFAGYTEDEIGV